jgi:hypothetical protein
VTDYGTPGDDRAGTDRSPKDGSPEDGSPEDGAPSAEPRPWLERIGLAAIALVMGALLTVMGIVAWAGGEWILAAMSASGAVLTVGVGLVTLIRG